MADTFGGLIDKLCVVNLKLWAAQDRVHRAAESAEGLDATTVKRLAALNFQRNELMTEIDETLDQSIKAGKAKIDLRPKF